MAHDRSLLARTVNEFWLVENGTLRRLESDLDGYTAQHNRARPVIEQDGARSAAASPQKPGPGKPGAEQDKKTRRKAAAGRRAQTQPLRKEIKQLERRIANLTDALADTEKRLADPEVYHRAEPAELDVLLKESAALRKKREDAEQRWLTVSEELEHIEQS